jgi:hypothetical protein
MLGARQINAGRYVRIEAGLLAATGFLFEFGATIGNKE